MKFFKKKSDKDLTESFNSTLATIQKNTLVPKEAIPPVLVMPKPRKFLTPTRSILGRFDRDKTQIEEEPQVNELDSIVYPQKISPILKPEEGKRKRYKKNLQVLNWL
jgi:hypothetical protein